jgi:hypothetical protein
VLNTLGVNTVVASLSDFEKITELVAASNVVVNTVFSVLAPLGPNFALNPTNRRSRTG